MLNKIKKSIFWSFIFVAILNIVCDTIILVYYNKIILNKLVLVFLAIISITVLALIMYLFSLTILIPLKHILEVLEGMSNEDAKVTSLIKKKRKNTNIFQKLIDYDYKEKEILQNAILKKNEVETILKLLNDGIISFDLNGNITNINNAAKNIFDIDSSIKFDELFEKLGLDTTMDKVVSMQGLVDQNKVINIEDKTYKILFELIKEQNISTGLIVVVQDITEQIRLDHLRKSFVADASHELKTPLTSIIGYCETLLDDDVDPKTSKKFIQRINDEAKRMAELVYDLLTLSKYDLAKQKIEKTQVKIDELTKEVAEKFRKNAEDKNIDIQIYIAGIIPKVFVDKSGIDRVITNIISNAIKYSLEDGQIDIYVGFIYNEVYIKVKDKGIGISKNDIEKVFERFYRVDSSRVRSKGGNGLGLPIAKEIVEQNDGQITLKSEYGVGTEVLIRLPIFKGENIEK